MTYGQQIQHLQAAFWRGLWRPLLDLSKIEPIEPATGTVHVTPLEASQTLYTGYEPLRRGDAADWSWHGPDGRIEE